MDDIKVGDTVECLSYGKLVRGTVVELGKWTGRPIKMRRHDNNRFHAIIGRDNCRKVEGE